MAKKGTKKKAAKKKAGKKKAAKKTAKKRSSPGTKTIVFRCKAGTCTASTGKKTHIGKKKSKVRLEAPANKVTLEFIDPDTGAQVPPPFVDPTNPIVIAQGSHKDEVVRDDASGHFFYDLKCENPGCGQLVEPPEMIVP
jgi:hypothetical protein